MLRARANSETSMKIQHNAKECFISRVEMARAPALHIRRSADEIRSPVAGPTGG